jgi:hypothetical protein
MFGSSSFTRSAILIVPTNEPAVQTASAFNFAASSRDPNENFSMPVAPKTFAAVRAASAWKDAREC